MGDRHLPLLSESPSRKPEKGGRTRSGEALGAAGTEQPAQPHQARGRATCSDTSRPAKGQARREKPQGSSACHSRRGARSSLGQMQLHRGLSLHSGWHPKGLYGFAGGSWGAQPALMNTLRQRAQGTGVGGSIRVEGAGLRVLTTAAAGWGGALRRAQVGVLGRRVHHTRVQRRVRICSGGKRGGSSQPGLGGGGSACTPHPALPRALHTPSRPGPHWPITEGSTRCNWHLLLLTPSWMWHEGAGCWAAASCSHTGQQQGTSRRLGQGQRRDTGWVGLEGQG